MRDVESQYVTGAVHCWPGARARAPAVSVISDGMTLSGGAAGAPEAGAAMPTLPPAGTTAPNATWPAASGYAGRFCGKPCAAAPGGGTPGAG